MQSVDAQFPLVWLCRCLQSWRAGLVLGWLLLSAGLLAQAAEPPKYSFSVVPQYSAIELHKDWAPLLARLSKDTGFTLELKCDLSSPHCHALLDKYTGSTRV
jgi:ABC-type phosphate/phosphonate transport system substrate-binding protein